MKKKLSKLLALTLCVALGLGLFGGAFAADEETGNYIVLDGTGLDWGSAIDTAIVHLNKPISGLTAEDIKVEVSYTAMDWSIFQYVDHKVERTVESFTVSDDGLEVTLKLAYSLADSNAVGYKYSSYEITLGDVVVTEVKEATHREESKWAKVDADPAAGHYGYRSYDPSADGYAKPEGGYPLIVWTHGWGDENRYQIMDQRVTAWAEKETQDIFGGAYVIALQCYKTATDETAKISTWQADSVISTIESFIQSVGAENVNTDKIVIGGCSAGGIAALDTIKEYPHYFAAAFPICTNTTFTVDQLIALKAMPMYIIQSIDDNSVPVENNAIKLYKDLTGIGSKDAHLALFEHVVLEGEPNPNLGHYSWTYAHNNFDGSEEYWAEEYTSADGTVCKTTKPSELGYTSFKEWLAGQVRPEAGVYYTIEREVMSFGEVVSSVTIHNLDRISALTKTEDWLKDNPITVTVKGCNVLNPDFTTEQKDVVRTPSEIVVGDDRTSVIVKFDAGKAITQGDNMASETSKYAVTLKGEEVRYGGESNAQVEAFESLTYKTPTYNWNGAEQTTMWARAFTPDKETYKQEKYPLIVWLHGGGEVGSDNRIQISANDIVAFTEKPAQDIFGGAYVLCPQNHAYADSDEGVRGEAAEATMSVIQQFIDEKGDIDETRIYISGCSYGGRGTWTMLRHYPSFFAAAFPTCASIFDPATFTPLTDEDIENLKDMPIYMTQSTGDQSKYVMSMITALNKLRTAGNEDVHLALFEHSVTDATVDLTGMLDHWVWNYLHDNYDAKGDDYDGKYFIDMSKDGEYNDGAVVVKDGILTYNYALNGEEGLSITLDYATERPEDTGFETILEWVASHTNENPLPFNDVHPTDECFEAVSALYKAGVTNGTSAVTYEPEATLTRAEFVTLLARAAGVVGDRKIMPAFPDLTEQWYMGSVAWAVETGLVIGHDDGTFKPNDPVTTEQVNLILTRYNENEGFNFPLYEDETGNATRGSVAVLIAEGLKTVK